MKVLKNYLIRPDQPLLRGHFPGRPILPGVMLLCFVRDMLFDQFGRRCRIKSIVRHKFVRPVLPGYNIRIECELKQTDCVGACPLNCRMFDQDDNLVASGTYQIEFLPS